MASDSGHIALLMEMITNRKKKFGIDYINLIHASASPAALKKCVDDALRDIANLQQELDEHPDYDGKGIQDDAETNDNDNDSGSPPPPPNQQNNNNNSNNNEKPGNQSKPKSSPTPSSPTPKSTPNQEPKSKAPSNSNKSPSAARDDAPNYNSPNDANDAPNKKSPSKAPAPSSSPTPASSAPKSTAKKEPKSNTPSNSNKSPSAARDDAPRNNSPTDGKDTPIKKSPSNPSPTSKAPNSPSKKPSPKPSVGDRNNTPSSPSKLNKSPPPSKTNNNANKPKGTPNSAPSSKCAPANSKKDPSPSSKAAPTSPKKNKTSTPNKSKNNNPSKSKVTPESKSPKSNDDNAIVPKKGSGEKFKPIESNLSDDPSNPSKWKLTELRYGGSSEFITSGEQIKVEGPILEGIENFKANPNKYTAMMYQTELVDWPENEQTYMLLHREGTVGYKPTGVSPNGWMTILLLTYDRCPPFDSNEFPHEFRDKYTDDMTYQKKKLHNKKNKPLMPGRGMGVGDTPDLKIIGDVDPSDIYQGSVGDCWLLSGISALAEFDGAVKKLFRKTKDLDKRPLDGPNQYIITFWDLKTWKEVDIVIDERLAAKADGSGTLLGARPSEDGELWVCYLEKAFACHAGGWDKIKGGQCTHAWAVMTGCKEQYAIRKNEKTGKYYCSAKYNPVEQRWNKHGNSPHDGETGMYQVPWPAVGGGGEGEITQEELFQKMYAWDKINYIVGAGTSGVSDSNSTDGMVDNHAYAVIECHDNVAGTEIDLLKVRNPWGQGEIEDGEFDDDGPGWDKYPQIKAELNPVVADDGIFWLTKDEFFKFFPTIYLSASNMTEFLED